MLATVKAHKLALLSREAELRAREARLAVILSSKDTSIHDLRAREKALADENAALGRAIEQQSTRIEERSTLMHELSEHQRTLQSEHEASLAKLITHVNSARAAREAEIEQAWAARELEISQEMVALFDGRARLAAEMRRLAEEFEGTDVAAVERGDVKDVESLARIVQALESPGVPVSVTRSRSRTLPRHLRPTAETPLRQQTGSTPAGARNSAALMAAAATITPAELELVCDGLPTSSSRGTWSRRSRIHRSASTGGARTAQSKTSTLTRRQMSEWSAHTDASALTAAPSDLFSSTSTFPEWSAEAMLAQLGKGYGDARAYGGI
ncbi:hypothetical protein PLICRDRAFT_555713 [Plicaturopsis crispa FD-325 SS-3]|nr:hypothetical protein PLICRDRAFT_555713 [Plicaturopsis crispa FD-325 SS-3]